MEWAGRRYPEHGREDAEDRQGHSADGDVRRADSGSAGWTVRYRRGFDPLHEEPLEGGELLLGDVLLRRGAGGAEGQSASPAFTCRLQGLQRRLAAGYQLRGVAARHPWPQIP